MQQEVPGGLVSKDPTSALSHLANQVPRFGGGQQTSPLSGESSKDSATIRSLPQAKPLSAQVSVLPESMMTAVSSTSEKGREDTVGWCTEAHCLSSNRSMGKVALPSLAPPGREIPTTRTRAAHPRHQPLVCRRTLSLVLLLYFSRHASPEQ